MHEVEHYAGIRKKRAMLRSYPPLKLTYHGQPAKPRDINYAKMPSTFHPTAGYESLTHNNATPTGTGYYDINSAYQLANKLQIVYPK